jgi:hypothetical protein
MATLRRWSLDRTNVFAYQLLVPDDRVPEWQPSGIRSLACQRDLYTTFAGGKELDEFEKWLNVEFETPGLEAIDKLLGGSKLTWGDWRSMIQFVAAQDLRTPLSFIEWMGWCEQRVPKMLERILQESLRRLEEAKEKGTVLKTKLARNELTDLLKVTIEPSTDPESNQVRVGAEMITGRRTWIAIMRHLLTGVAKTLWSHRWSVAELAGDAEWPLTDHPVLRLNVYKSGHYDFRGGWGSPGTQIMMPVSPRHLLYVKVGKKADNRFTFSPEDTQLVQRFLVERAHRWVFATRPEEWVAKLRTRTVDPKAFAAEKREWEEFHPNQLQSETSFANRGEPETDE